VDDEIKVRIRCDHKGCNKGNEGEWSGTIKKYQLGLLAIWFHSFHEGHKFSYWENDELILGEG
jgi:hypothetical protein